MNDFEQNDYDEFDQLDADETEGYEEPAQAEETAPEPEPVIEVSAPVTRVFKIGSTRIVESEETSGLTIEAVQVKLKRMYPEVANAVVREATKDGVHVVEFLSQPGRKG